MYKAGNDKTQNHTISNIIKALRMSNGICSLGIKHTHLEKVVNTEQFQVWSAIEYLRLLGAFKDVYGKQIW